MPEQQMKAISRPNSFKWNVQSKHILVVFTNNNYMPFSLIPCTQNDKTHTSKLDCHIKMVSHGLPFSTNFPPLFFFSFGVVPFGVIWNAAMVHLWCKHLWKQTHQRALSRFNLDSDEWTNKPSDGSYSCPLLMMLMDQFKYTRHFWHVIWNYTPNICMAAFACLLIHPIIDSWAIWWKGFRSFVILFFSFSFCSHFDCLQLISCSIEKQRRKKSRSRLFQF